MDLILIARRSRHYAGTRYLKRGINVHGKVANDVEVEQILQFENGADFKFTSYVQMRGSIPTFWAQETSLTMPKPPITLSRMDPDYLATQAHFADMMRRYSSPIIVLDLVKQHENRPRESLVGREFRQAIEIVNENIPAPYQVRYIALDHSKITSISKGKLSKAKPVKSKGFMGTMRPGKTEKERAMAAVGQEWAMMEKSLTKTPSSTAIGVTKGGGGGETPPGQEPGSTTPKKLQPVAGRSGTPVAGSSSSASSATAGGAAAAGFASLDEARKAIDAEHSMATYQFTPSAHHAHALPGGYDDIAQINAIESRIDLLKELEDVATLTLSETAFFCKYVPLRSFFPLLCVPSVSNPRPCTPCPALASRIFLSFCVARRNSHRNWSTSFPNVRWNSPSARVCCSNRASCVRIASIVWIVRTVVNSPWPCVSWPMPFAPWACPRIIRWTSRRTRCCNR